MLGRRSVGAANGNSCHFATAFAGLYAALIVTGVLLHVPGSLGF